MNKISETKAAIRAMTENHGLYYATGDSGYGNPIDEERFCDIADLQALVESHDALLVAAKQMVIADHAESVYSQTLDAIMQAEPDFDREAFHLAERYGVE